MKAKKLKLIRSEIEKALLKTYGLAKALTPKQIEFIDLAIENIKKLKLDKEVKDDKIVTAGMDNTPAKNSNSETAEDLH